MLAAKTVVYWYGGSLYFLQHGGDRLITFEMNGTTYIFDPNRMFTPIGRRKTLLSYSTYSPAADAAVTALANKVLEVYRFQARRIVVAIHNVPFSREAFSVSFSFPTYFSTLFGVEWSKLLRC